MIWHIFKKDWKLEWRLAVGVAFVQLLLSGMLWKLGPVPMISLLSVAALLARGFLIVETVHHDPLPGVRQDWLVRPIGRGALLAAKCLFAVLVVQVPVFTGDLIEALADGFSFGASFEAALSRSVYLLTAFSLPVLAISSVTKNLMEVLASGVFGVVIVALANILNQGSGPTAQKLAGTSIGWTVGMCCSLMIVVLSAAVLTMQFHRRMTISSRWLAAGGVMLLVGIVLLPWQQAAFALQSRLSPAPGAAHAVEIAFEANPIPVPKELRGLSMWNSKTNLRIPLSISGLPADSILADDHYEMRVIDSQGVIRAESLSYGAYQFLVGKQGAGPTKSLDGGNSATYNIIPMETTDYVRLKDQNMRMEIDYSLTLMELAESYALPAVHSDARLPGVGRCTTHVNELGDSISLSCLNAGPPPDCVSLFLEHTPSGRRNVADYACRNRDYSPFFAQFFPNALGRFGNGRIPFHDPTGQAHYAVDSPEISEAELVIRNYRPVEHFTRRVTTPERPLSEWLAR